MAEKNYSKTEIDLMIRNIDNIMKSNLKFQSEAHTRMNGKLDNILTNTIKTNGRVSKLEMAVLIIIGASVGILARESVFEVVTGMFI